MQGSSTLSKDPTHLHIQNPVSSCLRLVLIRKGNKVHVILRTAAADIEDNIILLRI